MLLFLLNEIMKILKNLDDSEVVEKLHSYCYKVHVFTIRNDDLHEQYQQVVQINNILFFLGEIRVNAGALALNIFFFRVYF